MEQQQDGMEKWMSFREYLDNEYTKLILKMQQDFVSSIQYDLWFIEAEKLTLMIEDYDRIHKF